MIRQATVEKRLADAKKLAAEGKLVIANETAGKPDSVSVKAYVRHGARRRPEGERGVLVIQWSRTGKGFGELTLTAEGGRLVADTECMGDGFVLDILAQALRERKEIG